MTQKPKASKQLTLDHLPVTSEKVNEKGILPKTEKQIVITDISALTKVDELALKVSFRLVPSKIVFSKMHSKLWFDKKQISSSIIRIPQGPLSTNEFEIMSVLDMKGIPAGSHTIKVEMLNLWDSGEKLAQTSRELNVDYVPQNRESRFVMVPSVKSVVGLDLAVVSKSTFRLYRDIEKTIKKEQLSKQDNY
jgi:hypothetical protein